MNILGIIWRRPQPQVLGALVVLAAVLVAVRLNETPVGAVIDDAYYVEMARSLAEGLGPVVHTGPDALPRDPKIFPPGFPLLLSPVAHLFPHSLAALKALPLLGTLLLLPLSLWLPGPAADNRMRLAVAAVALLNPWVIGWSGRILSDIPYAALSLGALLWFLRWQSRPEGSRWSALGWILLTAAAVSVRTIGWAAVLAMAAVLVTQRRWRWACALPAVVAALLAAMGGGGLLSRAYATQMLEHQGVPLWRFAGQNLLGYLSEMPVLIVPLFGKPVQAALGRLSLGGLYPALALLVGTLLLLLVVVAITRRWRVGPEAPRVRLITFYVVFYGAALAHFDGYPSGVQVRLVIPLLPILAWLILSGLEDLFGRRQPLVPPISVGLMLLAALGHNGWRVAHPLRTAVEATGHGLVDPSAGAAWLVANTEPGTVVMAQDLLARHIHCRRPLVGADSGDPEVAAAVIALHRPQYLWIAPEVHGSPRRLSPVGRSWLAMARGLPLVFRPVHQDTSRSVTIFHIRQP